MQSLVRAMHSCMRMERLFGGLLCALLLDYASSTQGKISNRFNDYSALLSSHNSSLDRSHLLVLYVSSIQADIFTTLQEEFQKDIKIIPWAVGMKEGSVHFLFQVKSELESQKK